jgi:hypothetical protein
VIPVVYSVLDRKKFTVRPAGSSATATEAAPAA